METQLPDAVSGRRMLYHAYIEMGLEGGGGIRGSVAIFNIFLNKTYEYRNICGQEYSR